MNMRMVAAAVAIPLSLYAAKLTGPLLQSFDVGLAGWVVIAFVAGSVVPLGLWSMIRLAERQR